jgi:hypothetical protein
LGREGEKGRQEQGRGGAHTHRQAERLGCVCGRRPLPGVAVPPTGQAPTGRCTRAQGAWQGWGRLAPGAGAPLPVMAAPPAQQRLLQLGQHGAACSSRQTNMGLPAAADKPIKAQVQTSMPVEGNKCWQVIWIVKVSAAANTRPGKRGTWLNSRSDCKVKCMVKRRRTQSARRLLETGREDGPRQLLLR